MTDRVLPTLEDVALKVDVSTSTVSRCLNEPWRVAEATRNRVLTAVAELGYSPNFGAQVLAAKRTNTFGAIVPTMSNAIFARGLQAFQDELMRNSATMLVSSSSYDAQIEEHQIRTLVARGADGLLLIGKRRSKSIYKFLEGRGIPVVMAWTIGKAHPWSYVGFDNAAGSASLAARAVELGHRRFAFLSGERAMNDRASDRVRGVVRVLRQNDLEHSGMCIIESAYTFDAAGDAFQRIMESSPRPTIVMCGNDVQAVGALKRAQALGICVPEEVSITGFDDVELATVVEPGLTTVHVPHREMGRRAAELLLAQVAGECGPKRIKLQTHVVERQSLAPPGG
ncbi:MAG: LacI family DNA-binding transcriptional regulator [Granulosicoccus sp.]|nr:LacI family DNA-binding transcriptional regulator [Granulosicoccus sp.]